MQQQSREERRRIAILGVRGVPAAHGGFETFAERLAPRLARGNWDVRVYCQESRLLRNERRRRRERLIEKPVWESTWEGVTRIHITVPSDTAMNSIRFDWLCISHVLEMRPDAVLILGYNTAVFAARLRLAGIPTVINMDGIEWSREKWGALQKIWLYLNERAGCRLAHHLIADHPHIARHLQNRADARKITVIPYGAELLEADSDQSLLRKFGVASKSFATLIARPEPENSILEMVRSFSATRRSMTLLVLGNYYPASVKYHAAVMSAASDEVVFAGAVYDKSAVAALRRHSRFYMHGHQVGGCNPSLLEAMGAGNAVLARDNRFNRWVVGDGALYFSDGPSCEGALEEYLRHPERCDLHGELNRRRAREVFDWEEVLSSYAELLEAVASEIAAAGDSGWGRRAQWCLEAQ